MDHYGTSAWKTIQENLFPTKTARQVCMIVLFVICIVITVTILQLQLRVKNQCSNRTGDNTVKVSLLIYVAVSLLSTFCFQLAL